MSVANAKRIVIKVGSSTLTYAGGKPNLRKIEQLAMVISDMKNSGKEVILVSSGAIAVGVSSLRLKERPTDTRGKQAAAAVGQCDLMSIYDRFFSEYGYKAAQILINRDVVDHDERKQNVINTIETLLEMGAVPIINENDSVSVEEILFGDNDRLSSIVAVLSGADLLIILSDIEGYYESDPHEDPHASMIAVVHEVTADMIEAAGGSGSAVGTGGMRTKLEAAQYAMENHINMVIMSGDRPQRMYDLLDGRNVGTLFKAK